MPRFAKCLTIKAEWAAAAAAAAVSSKQNKLPVSKNCSLTLKICFNDLARSWANNLMFTDFHLGTNSGSHSVYQIKGTNIVMILKDSVSSPCCNTSRNDTTEKVWPHYIHIFAVTVFPVTHSFIHSFIHWNVLCDSTSLAHCSYVWVPNGFYEDPVCQQLHIHQYLTGYEVAFLTWQLKCTHELMISSNKILFHSESNVPFKH